MKKFVQLAHIAIGLEVLDDGPIFWGPAKLRVTVYDVLVGELRFLNSHTT